MQHRVKMMLGGDAMIPEHWLRVSIPLQGLLVLSQLITGLNVDRIPPSTYTIVHIGGGVLLVVLIVIHVVINADWVKKTYRRRS
ncbi:MAG TPA: hypothetical protein VGL77_08020 [Armatimonadota bacterium]